jgi:hypothetical protein
MTHIIQSSLLVSGSITVTGGITGSVTGSVTGVLYGNATTATTAQTASYYIETDPTFTAKSASLATTGSNTFNGNQTIAGNLDVIGTASIAYLNVVIESSSVIYSSGSNQFGDALDDQQTIIGITTISGSLSITGSASIPNLTGSLQGNAATATTSSYAATASYWSGSIQNATSASFAESASWAPYQVSASYAESALSASWAPSSVTGSANYITKFASATTLGASAIYESGSNVGIGTTNPTAPLYISASNVSSTVNTFQIRDRSNTGDLFNVKGNGDVSIGFTSNTAGYKLDVLGSGRFRAATGTNANLLVYSVTSEHDAGLSLLSGDGVTWGLSTCNYHIAGAFGIRTGARGTEKFVISTTGNVGIGTTTPTARLHVTASGALSTDIAFRVRNSANTFDIIRANGAGEVFLGLGAGNVNTGANNTFIGISSGGVNTSGANNIGIGLNTLRANTTGQENIAIGVNALLSNTTALYNIAIGLDSLRTNTIGTQNTGIGQNSLRANTIGNSNTAIGSNSLFSNTDGSNNTAVGIQSLWSNTTGTQNTSIGAYTMRQNSTGYLNTAIGYQTSYYNTTGYFNNSIGYRALYNNSSGRNNVAIGHQPLLNNAVGSYNVAIGGDSLLSNISGSYNAAYGELSGRFIADGSTELTTINNSVFIGAGTKALADNQTNQIVIGYNAVGLGSNTAVLGNDSITTTALKGNVGIGKTTPNAKLDVNGNTIMTGSLTIVGVMNQGSPFNTASGQYSHAEGYQTTASGQYSHAEGQNTKSTGTTSHAEGINTLSPGLYSHAEGESTNASGRSSHTEGEGTTTTARGSHAEGSGTVANGNWSHAEGHLTITVGQYSHAEGYLVSASGQYSHAEGSATQAIGQLSHAEGDRTQAKGYGSHAEGVLTVASASYSHAEGASTISSGPYSHAEGRAATSFGEYSHAEGYGTVAFGSYSHAEGGGTISSGSYSHAEGFTTTAIGYSSHAEGERTLSSGSYSHAEGYSTQANGTGSHAEGYLTIAIGDYSHTEGLGTITSGSYQHVQGQYNQTKTTQSAFIVGNGTNGSSRSNLIFAAGSEVHLLGNVGIGTSSPTSRLHVAAAGALSTDIAFKVRNSADTTDWFKIDGTGAITLNNAGGTGPILTFAKLNAGSGYFYADGSSILSWSNKFRVASTAYVNDLAIVGYGANIQSNNGGIIDLDNIVMKSRASLTMRPNFNLNTSETGSGLYIAPLNDLGPTKKLMILTNSSGSKTYFTVNGLGQVGIGTATPTALVHVVASSSLSTESAFKIQNSGSTTTLFNIGGTGNTTISGSLSVSGGITGSLQGTASYAQDHAPVPTRYICNGYLTTNQTIATGSDVVIQFEDYDDPNGWLDGYKFTPTIAGYYHIDFGVWLDNPGSTTNQVNVQMRKNGVTHVIIQQPLNNSVGQSLAASKIIYLNGSTDQLEFTIFQSVGSSATGTILQGTPDGSGTWFSAFLITQ